jgi:alkanesulfonate monooxygenase SsuD/methylene tetrahydromethanopterin reductase-like flavin-dependent oxidoreductase (luciferase family)
MKVSFFLPPTIGPKEELYKGMAGRRTDLYQTMLRHLVEFAQYVDEHGYHAVGFTEHHMSIEGMTCSNCPGMLDLYLGDRTKNLHLGVLGYVLPVHDPFRVAAEIAMLDQMTQGRAIAGFARGVQTRWVNTMGQHRGLADNITDTAAYNERNRELYDEHLEIIIKAWSNDTFTHKGKHWEIPPKNVGWPGEKSTREMGAGLDDDGKLVAVGVTPATYNKRIPEMYEPFAAHKNNIYNAARRGLIPVAILTYKDFVLEHLAEAQRGWSDFGTPKKLGEGFGSARYCIVADTDAQAREWAEMATFEWTYFFNQFGFNAVLARPGEDWKTIPSTMQEYIDREILFCGTPDTVIRQMERTFEYMPCEHLWLFTGNELLPQQHLMRSMELMTEKVLPHFTDTIKTSNLAAA